VEQEKETHAETREAPAEETKEAEKVAETKEAEKAENKKGRPQSSNFILVFICLFFYLFLFYKATSICGSDA